MKGKARVDLIVSLFFAVFSIVVFLITLNFPVSEKEVGVSTFPRLLSGLLFLMSAILAIQALRKRNTDEGYDKLDKQTFTYIIITTITIIGYILLINIVGFIITTILLLFLSMFVYGERRKSILILVPILFTAGVYILFEVLAKVPFPSGFLEGIF